MATRNPNSVAGKIRAYIAANPKAKAKDVAAAVGTTAARVYTVIHLAKNHKAKTPKQPKPEREPRLDDIKVRFMDPTANSTQVGGTHYQSQAIQPWDYITSNNLGYLEGNVVKYVSRWKAKGGLQDLEKAQHYLSKLMEMAESMPKRKQISITSLRA